MELCCLLFHFLGKKGPNITFASGGYQQSGKNLPNNATPFGNSSASNPPNVDWNEFQRQFQDPVFSSNNRGIILCFRCQTDILSNLRKFVE